MPAISNVSRGEGARPVKSTALDLQNDRDRKRVQFRDIQPAAEQRPGKPTFLHFATNQCNIDPLDKLTKSVEQTINHPIRRTNQRVEPPTKVGIAEQLTVACVFKPRRTYP